MSEPKPFDAGAVADAMLPLLGLEIEPAWKAGITANLEVTVRFAALVLAAELEDEAEPAPVFVA